MSELEYARAEDGTHIAYRVLPATGADAAADIVMVSGGLFPMETFEEDAGFARLLEGLSSLGRVVVFDRRGLGLSDPIADWERPIIDQWADDLHAVTEAIGAPDPVVFAWDGFGIATRFAAAHPDRLRLLVLHQPVVLPDDAWDDWVTSRLASIQDNMRGAQGDFLTQIAPSRASEAAFRAWYTRAGRVGASPATAARIWESVFRSGPSDQLLERVEAPTLVLHRRDNVYAPPEAARHASELLARATIVELDGGDHFPFVGDVDAVVAEIAGFVLGERRLPPPQRVLAAVMFTDLVSSTEHAASIGDAAWKSVLERHDAATRSAVGRRGGTVVKHTGDGFLSLLPSAGAALRAAEQTRDDLAADGLAVRIGIHLGDIDRRGDDVSGLSVHIAARVMGRAGAGQILVSAAVPAAVAGQAATFTTLGRHELKGVPGEWELLALDDPRHE